MSPAPARTSDAAIVAAARALLEADGLDAVTMASVAERVGVRPSSLYKHVVDRSSLIAALATDAAEELGRVLASADPGPAAPAGTRLSAVTNAYRGFARRTPRAASLLFVDLGPGSAAAAEANAAAARPVLEIARSIVGEADTLSTARVLTAFAYGFTSMESAGAFRLGGSVDDAFTFGLSILLRGLTSEPAAPPQVEPRAPGVRPRTILRSDVP